MTEATAALGVSSDGARASRLEQRFERPILLAALFVVPVLVIDNSGVSHGWRTVGLALNWFIWLAFATEVVVLLAAVPNRAAWLRDHPLELALVVLTPPFLPASLGALRLFRLLRLLRLGVVVKESWRLFTPQGVRLVGVIAGASAVAGGAIFAGVEKGYSMWDGIWWAVTTMATVGYGDLSPRTVVGRLVGVALMVIGIGFFALLTGSLASRFLSPEVKALEGEVAAEGESIHGVMVEMRAIRDRLTHLEARLQRLAEEQS